MATRSKDHARSHEPPGSGEAGMAPASLVPAMLDALTNHIAVLDEVGVVIAVNAAWRRFAEGNGLLDPAYGIGTNYVQVCESNQGNQKEFAHAAAQGLRAIIEKRSNEFALEYPCDSQDRQEWYLLQATRIADEGPARVLVSHQNITERRHTEQALRQYAERLQVLRQSDLDILSARSPETIARAALHHIRQLVPYQRASITSFDFKAGEAVTWAVATDTTNSVGAGMRHALNDFRNIDTLQRGEAFVVDDIDALPQPGRVHQLLRQDGIKSYFSVPIVSQGQLIGALNLASTEPKFATSRSIDIAREVGAQLAVAIQNARLFEQVRAGRERLRALSQQLVQAQEEERRHLARELHDEIGQSLTAAQLNLQTLLNLSDLAELPARLEDSMALIERVLQQIRALSLELRPALLDDLGLVPALRWFVNRQAQRAGFAAHVVAEQSWERFPPDVEITCFRVVQEALTNIIRHAQAQHVMVEIQPEATELHLVVRDDGVGFDANAARDRAMRGHSLGLLSMQERVVLLGGQIRFESAIGQGTKIFVRLPLSANAGEPIERRKTPR